MKILETKIPPPVVALAFALLIWIFANYLPRIEIGVVAKTIVVTLLVVIGVSFDLSGLVNFFRVKTTINPMRPHKASALVKTGIYRIKLQFLPLYNSLPDEPIFRYQARGIGFIRYAPPLCKGKQWLKTPERM